MNLAKPNVSKKAVLLIIAVAILGLLAGSAATYLAVKDNLVSDDQAAATTQANNNTAPDAGAKLETKIPEGTVSPTAIMKAPAEYKDKDVKVRGLIVDAGNKNYFVTGQETSGAGSVSLDLANAGNIDVTKFVGAYTDPKQAPIPEGSNSPAIAKPATVSGKVKVDETGKLTLVVTNIES